MPIWVCLKDGGGGGRGVWKSKGEEWQGAAAADHSGLGSDVSLFASLSSSLSRPARATVRRTVKGTSLRLGGGAVVNVSVRGGEQPSASTS